MVETVPVLWCAECRVTWEEGIEPRCADESHERQRFEMHKHRTPVDLPDGTTITCASFHEIGSYERDTTPDFGVYLDHRWQPPWAHVHVDWPDFGVPASKDDLLSVLRSALERARDGAHVELGCWGAHGRTGTALACLAVLTGVAPGEAVDWVRRAYCEGAVETPEQEAFVATLDVSSGA